MASPAADRAVRYGIVAGAVLVALVLLVVFFPWNALRGPLASYAGARFDRSVTLDGDLTVDLGWVTRVQLDDVTLANASWSSEQPMAQAKRVVLWFTPESFLNGVPIKARLVNTDVLLERHADGADNWHLGKSEAVPRIGNIEIDHGKVRYRDKKERTDLTLELQTLASGDREGLSITGNGTLNGEALQLEGSSLGLAQLQNIDDPYRLSLRAKAGRTSADFNGTVVPSDTENVRGVLHLQGPDLSKLYPVVPAALPWTPPYNLRGDLTHAKRMWVFRGMRGTVGESDLRGDVKIDLSTPRSMMTAELSSTHFDSKDLGGFIGLPPGGPSQRAQTPEQRSAEQRRSQSYRVLPDKPIELAKLREHDADVKFRGTSVKWGAIPMDNLTAHIRIDDGVLKFDPLDFGIADGHVIANIAVDAKGDVGEAQGEIEARNVELKRLFPKLVSPQGTAGRFGGRAHFRTKGNTVAAMLAAADGDAAVIMRGGKASTLRLALTNLDLARAAELLLRGDETAEIRCAVGALHAKDGVMTPDLFVVDTSAVVITGSGSVDFHDETYNLALDAKSKRPSLVALRGPMMIRGTFKAPVVGPAIGPVAARVGTAVGLGLVAPPLSLLPLIDFGGAGDVDCRSLIDQARVNTATTERIRKPGSAKRPTPAMLARDRAQP